jgi:hypothetical protein
LFKGCGEEMHRDWWALLGIKKPCGDEKGRKGGDWITTTLILNDLQGEFIEFKKLYQFKIHQVFRVFNFKHKLVLSIYNELILLQDYIVNCQ